MSVVYLATDLHSDVNHAVKIILPEFIDDDREVAERYLAEATAPSTLHHPNIVKVTDSGLLGGVCPFLVMDFITGPSLHAVLSERGPLEPSVALEYISTIGMALGAGHERGIVHGDLKPRSILIEKDLPVADAIRITDYGQSSIKSGKHQSAAKSSGVLRSPLYLAPEEFSEEVSDYRSDIYSLGVILYEMLSGEVPFRAKSIPGIMKQHLLDAPPPIASVTPEIERVVMHALEKDPALRPHSMDHFVEEFASAINAKDKPAGVDMNQTIVLAKAGRGSVNSHSVQHDNDRVVKNGELPEASEPDFDATILPGMMKFKKDGPGPAPSVHNEQVQQTWDQEADDQVFSDEATELSDDAPVPRTFSPVLLAAGVLVFVMLIALGVYYSRTAQ